MEAKREKEREWSENYGCKHRKTRKNSHMRPAGWGEKGERERERLEAKEI